MNRMKNAKRIGISCFIAIALIIKAVSTFTLCGGTLMQNWMGFGACTDSQSMFMGITYDSIDGTESFGALFLFFFILVSVTFWLVMAKLKRKKLIKEK